MKVATEDIKPIISDYRFASLVRSANDELDTQLEQLLDNTDVSDTPILVNTGASSSSTSTPHYVPSGDAEFQPDHTAPL